MPKRRDLGNAIQGLACLGILWFILFGDPTRLPTQWLAAIPGGFLTSGTAFLIGMALLYFIEGAHAAQSGDEAPASPLRRALGYYISYWKVCAPLVLIGGLFFCEISESPIYCPMFRNLGFLNVSRAILALSNNIHEGTWLISSIAICAFCAALFPMAKRKRGTGLAVAVLLGGIALQAVLYLKVLPFMYNARVYRIAAVAGPSAHALGFLLFQGDGALKRRVAHLAEGLPDNRALTALSGPFKFIGRKWTTFWMAQFYVAMYYYHVAASVYADTGRALLSYLIFLVMTCLLLYGLDWGYRRLQTAFRRSWRVAPAILSTLAVPFLLRLALETSMDAYAQFAYLAARQWPIRAMVNVLAIFSLILILRALIGHWLPAGLTVTVLMTLLAIANHYTMKYHGALLTVEDIHNVGTVTGVIGSYDLSVDAVAGRILLLEAAAAACCVLAWLCARPLRGLFTRRQRWVNRLACLLAAAVSLYFSYFSAVPIIERQDNIWSWGSLYAKIGYLSGTVESTLANMEFSVYRPDGYSDGRIAELAEAARRQQADAAAEASDAYPDIVMILNETWYDLDRYIDTGADVDYLANYRALDNAIKGYAEVPLTGGGTNGTEYEMLTSNSMTLINAYAPFNRLNFADTVTLPRYLKQLGYATVAAHPHESQNYHRGMSWSQMGIDQTHFIQDFTELEYYADRNKDHEITDTTALKNLIRFMDELPGDGPRFAFLATMQNHGDWTNNRPEQALVHSHPATADEALVGRINEYLSCLTYTDAMIGFMQQYYTELYERTGRRVVVCMVGDHSPSFLPELEGLCKWQDRALAERMGKQTPFYIWANYPLDLEDEALPRTESMDLCCLMPAVLRAAGVPLSYYYRYILDMNRDVAVYTNVGSETAEETRRIAFYDREGLLHYVDEDAPLARAVSDYFCMEYNLNGEDTRQEPALFEPTGSGKVAPAADP
ncbi:MAG: LTA synthase family protein [Clostridia bacterium]|nr:LTA synthase family protein [Clostridia bacterium]